MKKIIFLHGFYASGQCVPANAIRDAFGHKAIVITPDIPLYPSQALAFIRELCQHEQPDILVGNSCGSFYAQIVASALGIPALLGNPHFRMTEFLESRVGHQQYKSPRANGKQNFVVDEALIKDFAEMQSRQFNDLNPDWKDRIWGLFGQQDTLAHFEPLFLQYYNHSYHFPGGHTPSADEVVKWYVPLIEQLLVAFSVKS